MIADTDTYTNIAALESLKSNGNNTSRTDLVNVAQQFEALFVQMMMKEMRNSSLDEGLLDSDASKFYRDIYDQQMSVELGKRGLGIADMLVQQLTSTKGSGKAGSVAPVLMQQRASLSPDLVTKQQHFASPEDFVRTLLPLAKDVAQNSGISPNVLLAQAALETGWGKFIMSTESNGNSHNLFGIKAKNGWNGPSIVASTTEVMGGRSSSQMDIFRSYKSYKQSFVDYARFIMDQPRYEKAMAMAGDAEEYSRELQNAGYSTDPQYADKIIKIMTNIEQMAG